VLAPLASVDLRAYIVWLPMLEGDTREAAERDAHAVGDRRVSQFWDGGQALGRTLGRVLELPPRREGDTSGVAWDVYLVYPPGAVWTGEAPRPGYWMHQLSDVSDEKAPVLDGAELRRRVAAARR
jgi:hypothetical protein